MMSSVLCESPRVRHPQEKCASKCVRGLFLSAFICFVTQICSVMKNQEDLVEVVAEIKQVVCIKG